MHSGREIDEGMLITVFQRMVFIFFLLALKDG